MLHLLDNITKTIVIIIIKIHLQILQILYNNNISCTLSADESACKISQNDINSHRWSGQFWSVKFAEINKGALGQTFSHFYFLKILNMLEKQNVWKLIVHFKQDAFCLHSSLMSKHKSLSLSFCTVVRTDLVDCVHGAGRVHWWNHSLAS